MKKVGIITIYDNGNFGNRLQNYATQETLKKLGVEPTTLKNLRRCNIKPLNIIEAIKLHVIYIIKVIQNNIKKSNREKIFEEFNKKYINLSNNYITGNNAKKINKKFDYFLTGSDQVWNPKFKRMSYVDLLGFTSNKKKSSFSASFGISQIEQDEENKLKKYLNDYKYISVRENEGKNIVEKAINRNDVDVLLDPTMLLTSTEWDKIARKPQNLKNEKYILLYFLGTIPKEWESEIDRIAKEYKCDIINILDKEGPFYNVGPDEFVYLEKNAFLVCTDSFHSSVFAILYNRPFVVFERIVKKTNMNSRLNTLLNKFKLENRKFEGKITNQQLGNNYKNVEVILQEERAKSINFLKKALDLEEENEI